MTTQAIDPRDSLVLFADLQEGIVELTNTNPLPRLKKGVHALAKLARILEIPIIVSGVPGEGGASARMIPQIAEGHGTYAIHHRTTANSLLNDEIVKAIKSSGRKTLLISGVATELAVQLPAVTAAEHGLRAFVVVDACGGMSERSEQAALARVAHCGGSSVSVMTLAGELAGDFRTPVAQQAIGVVFEMAAG
jgi:isochorismate hydrolase